MLTKSLTLACLLATPLFAQQTPARLTQFLKEGIGLGATQVEAIERGDPVVKALDTQSKRDVAVFGIITLAASRESYVRQSKDFKSSLRNPNRVAFGIFSNPATAADVQSLVVSQDDANDLKKCRPGDCKSKVPGTEMQTIRDQVNWSGDVQAQVSAYVRQRLVKYVTDYRARGDSEMVVYDDNGRVRASEAFAALVAQSPYVYQFVPALANYLTDYPRGKLDGTSDVIFWSEDAAPHIRRTISATHLVVYEPADSPGMTVVAAKQIYASHYFEAGFDLTSIIDRPAGGSYLITLRRYRFDNLPTGGLLNLRGRVVGSLQDKMLADLKREKATAH